MTEYAVRLRATPCANGETQEWDLLVGEHVIGACFLTDATPAEAFRIIARRVSGGGWPPEAANG